MGCENSPGRISLFCCGGGGGDTEWMNNQHYRSLNTICIWNNRPHDEFWLDPSWGGGADYDGGQFSSMVSMMLAQLASIPFPDVLVDSGSELITFYELITDGGQVSNPVDGRPGAYISLTGSTVLTNEQPAHSPGAEVKCESWIFTYGSIAPLRYQRSTCFTKTRWRLDNGATVGTVAYRHRVLNASIDQTILNQTYPMPQGWAVIGPWDVGLAIENFVPFPGDADFPLVSEIHREEHTMLIQL